MLARVLWCEKIRERSNGSRHAFQTRFLAQVRVLSAVDCNWCCCNGFQWGESKEDRSGSVRRSRREAAADARLSRFKRKSAVDWNLCCCNGIQWRESKEERGGSARRSGREETTTVAFQISYSDVASWEKCCFMLTNEQCWQEFRGSVRSGGICGNSSAFDTHLRIHGRR